MCENPIQIEYTDYLGYKRWMSCPCGKCYSCLQAHRDGWAIRLYEEAKQWSYVTFITLTYNNDNLPLSINYDTGEALSTVDIHDVSSAIKRFRTDYSRRFGKLLDFKYFVCSEYGSKGTKRPHYHGLFFHNEPLWKFGHFFRDWQQNKGFTYVKSVPYELDDRLKATRYVSKYITKKSLCSRSDDILSGLISAPSFIMSKGIGASYVSEMFDYHRNCEVHEMVDRMYYTFDGKVKYALPKYYKDRFYKKVKVKYYYDVHFNEDASSVSFSYLRRVKRFTSEHLLSIAISDIVRARRSFDFYRGVHEKERRGKSRFQSIAETWMDYDYVTANKVFDLHQRLADEVNIRYFTDFHSDPIT